MRAEAASINVVAPLVGGEDSRRERRVLLRVRTSVHLAIKGKVTTLTGITLSVHDRGAIVVLDRNVPVDARLVLENSNTREKIACKVSRPARATPEGYHTAIEFDSPSPEFWKIAFPPSDWRAGDD
ncbi:MAG TPA: hypothetical protein VN661_08635 [Candidatus Acidoferrales bacterium]|nr:hypothetical protein [Candidatus Acidoferrales bacterium]